MLTFPMDIDTVTPHKSFYQSIIVFIDFMADYLLSL